MRKRSELILGMTAVLCAGIMSISMAAESEAVTEAALTESEAVTEAVSMESETAAGADAAESEAATEAPSLESETAAGEDAALQADEEIPETIRLNIEDLEEPIEIQNTAKLNIAAVSVEPLDEEHIDITMKSSDGLTYEFKNVRYVEVVRPELVVEGAFAYIKYTSIVDGEERSIGQDKELTYDEPAELFAVDDVYIREEPNGDAEILGVISRGDAIEVLGETADYYKVKKDDVTGYSVRRCVSEDEQEAIAAVKAEEAAREAIRIAQEEAARQAAAQQAAAARSSRGSSSKGSGVHETGRQKFDDCDGSGHGYYEITYSDGSIKYEEY